MNALTFALILLAILLSTAAQLMLKLGTNAVGAFAFTLENVVPVGLKLALDPRILAGIGIIVGVLLVARS